MATILTDRIYGYGGAMTGRGGLKAWFPVAASLTGRPGYIAVMASGLLSAFRTVNAFATQAAGVLEQYIPTALTAKTLVQITLATPGAFFEGSVGGATSLALAGTMRELKTSTANSGIWSVLKTATVDGTAGALVVFLPGEQHGVFTTGGYIGKSDTSPTAGATNKPYAALKGVSGDTNGRVVFYFPPSTSVWD